MCTIGALANTPGRQQFPLRTVSIRIEILNPDQRLLPELTAPADVLAEREVYLQTPDGIERPPVIKHRIHGSQTALTEGVAEGDIIVVE